MKFAIAVTGVSKDGNTRTRRMLGIIEAETNPETEEYIASFEIVSNDERVPICKVPFDTSWTYY